MEKGCTKRVSNRSLSTVIISNLNKLVGVEEDPCELVRGEESGDEHGAVELLEDDAEVPAVLDFRLEDLADDVAPLRATLPAHVANRGGSRLAAA